MFSALSTAIIRKVIIIKVFISVVIVLLNSLKFCPISCISPSNSKFTTILFKIGSMGSVFTINDDLNDKLFI